MKKRVKLLTTIASLCLAVALMAFGVYAATTASLSVTSKVSFEAKDVYVTIAAAQYKGEDGATANKATDNSFDTVKTYTEETNKPVAEGDAAYEWLAQDFDLDTTDDSFRFLITITNDGTDDVVVTFTNNSAATLNFDAATVVVKDNGTVVTADKYAAGVTLSQDEAFTFEIYSSITDITTKAEFNVNLSFSINRAGE